MNRWQALLAQALIAFALGGCTQSDPAWYVYMEEARHACALHDEKATKQALAQAKAEAQKSGGCPAPLSDPPAAPREPRTYTGELCSLADCLAFHRQFAEAETLDEEALNLSQLNPDKTNISSPLHALADVYEKEEKYSQAESMLRTLVEKTGGNFDNLFALVKCLILERKNDQALELSTKGVEEEKRLPVKSPKLTDHLNLVGYCYYTKNDLDRAEKIYLEALNYNPVSSDSESGDQFNSKDLKPLADLYFAKNDWQKADTYYRSALSGHFERPMTERIQLLKRYSYVLQQIGKDDQSIVREQEYLARERALKNEPPAYRPTIYD
jgi:tetratricopeptide (TPR) repeat protein